MSSDPLRDHFRHPRNVGEVEPRPGETGSTGCVEVENPVCGDVLRLSWRLAPRDRASGDPVVELVRFRVRGCPASVAAGSALTELLEGCRLSELESIHPARVSAALGGLDGHRHHVAVLASDAVRAMLGEARGR